MTRALPLVLAAVVLSGCGGGSGSGTIGPTTPVYFLRDGVVWPVAQEVEDGDGVALAALEALEAGPSGDASDLDIETALEEGSLDLDSLEVSGGVASVASSGELTPEARAQVVYTLGAVPEVASVELDGAAAAPGDFEEQTPSVLVQSPLPFQAVSSPLRANGTANTFEATFSFEILDEDGEVLAGDFVTATSGSGTRGTFTFEQPFVVEEQQDGTLLVFELSAEDGSRMNEVEIPLLLLP